MEQVHVTKKEKQVLELTFTGKQRKEVAVILGVETSAIKWHMANLHRKFGVNTTVEMIYKALQQGLLKVPSAS